MPTRLPRINIVVTEEQHALLSELAQLDPTTRSSAGFVRELLDQVTPLLRAQVPAMRVAAQEKNAAAESLREPLRAFLDQMEQMNLLDVLETPSAPARSGVSREDGRTARRSPRQ